MHHAQAAGHLVGDRGEHLRRGDPARDECRDPPKRGLFVTEPG